MYNKGLQSLKALDETLASMRKEALRVSRATPQDVQRFMIREDVHRQNTARKQSQSCDEANGPGIKCVGVEGGPLPTWYDGDLDVGEPSTSLVADDVAERVAQAEQTLYPILLASVAGYEWTEEPDAAVVERDANGAPLRIMTIRSPDRSSVPSRRCATASVVQSSGAESFPHEANSKTISFDKVYEYTPGEDPLKSALLMTRPPQLRQAKLPAPSGRIHGARAPPLSSEGCAVAESSACGMARGIRRAVLAQRNGQKENANSNKGVVSQTDKHDGISVLREVSNAPMDSIPDVVFARVVQPVTAFFCPSCGTCAARDVITGMPDACAACHEPFGKLPSTVEECPTHAGLQTPPPESMWKNPTPTVRAKTTTATSTGTDPVPCAKNDRAESRTAETQSEVEVPSALKNFSQLTDGLYFLHLWDQAMGQCASP